MEGMISVFAEFDNNVRRERCMSGMLERVRQGFWVWAAPIGYYRPGRAAQLLADPAQAPLVRLAFQEYAKRTYTYEGLSTFLAERGMRTTKGKPPTRRLIESILKNPIYCGVIEVWGERHQAGFEPLVSLELFEQCQPARRATTDPRPARTRYNPAFPLRRAICTACNTRLTGSFCRARNGVRYPYYHHQRRGCAVGRFIPTAALDAAFADFLKEISPSSQFAKVFQRVVKDKWAQMMREAENERARLDRELQSLLWERQRVFELHRSGAYTDDEFREQKSLVSERIAQLERARPQFEGDVFKLEPALAGCLELTRETAAFWARLDPSWRRRFELLIFSGGEVRFDGTAFSNHTLTSIYRLNLDFTANSMAMVDLVGQKWNQLLEDVKECARFMRELQDAERPSRRGALS